MSKLLDLGLVTPLSLGSRDHGHTILNLIGSRAPALQPDRYGNWEPEENVFDPANIEKALESWKDPFLWKRRKPAVEGHIMFGKGLRHSGVYVSCAPTVVDQGTVVELLTALAVELHADFAYAHLCGDAEASSEAAQNTLVPFRRGVTTHDLRKNLPNLCWATVFGAPYVRLFGKDRILSAPATRVTELGADLVYVQLTEKLSDLKRRYAEVDAVRQAVKRHLDHEAFYEVGRTHGYNVPAFIFEDPTAARKRLVN